MTSAGKRRFGRGRAWLGWGLLGWGLAALLVAPVLAVGGDAARAFRTGIEAADRGQWNDTAEAMERAVAAEPAAGGRVKIYGMRFETYLPHYWLGLARDELGDCVGATPAFETAAQNFELLMPAQRRDLETRLRRCRAQQQATPPAFVEEPEASGRSTPTAVQQAPPFLRRAAADYLAGRYDDVAAQLGALDTQTRDPRAAASGLLLRAASRFAQHRRTPDLDPILLDAARRDVSEFQRRRPGERPSAFWFSPAFLALFEPDDGTPDVPADQNR